jgi:small multidrug resistance pump
MNFCFLLGIVLLDAAGSTFLKLSQGFSHLLPVLAMLLCYSAEQIGLVLILNRLDLSLVYAVRSSAGMVLVAVIGIAAFHEPLTAGKAISLSLIVLGVIGLNYGGAKTTSISPSNCTDRTV